MLFAKLTVTMTVVVVQPIGSGTKEEAERDLEVAGHDTLIDELREGYRDQFEKGGAELKSLTGTIEVVEV